MEFKKSSKKKKQEPRSSSSDSDSDDPQPISAVRKKHVGGARSPSSSSSSDDGSHNEMAMYKNLHKKSKVKAKNNGEANVKKEKIYSSSEDEEDVKPSKTKATNEVVLVGGKGGGREEEVKPDVDDVFFDGWTKVQVMELISRMEKEIPQNDTLKSVSRVEKLDWEKIKFGSYSAQQCKDKWKTIEKKIRAYRFLSEVLTDSREWLEHPWTNFYKGNKKKNQQHPDMPKKPLSSYMIFYTQKKDKIARLFPGLSMTELSKRIGEKYNNMPENKKALYTQMALEMKHEYLEKMKKFLEEHPNEMAKMSKEAPGKSRKFILSGGITGPAKPVAPVKLFITDKMKQHQGDPLADQIKLSNGYKEKWKLMSSKKKIPWIRWANDMEVKYLEELKGYQKENPSYEMPNHKSVLSKEEKQILQKTEGKPEKPPTSAYGLFSKQMLKDSKLKQQFPTPKQRLQEIARLWKTIPKVDKEGYAERVKHLLDSYKLEYASYLESLPEDKREEELASQQPKRRLKPEGAAANKKPRTDGKLAEGAPIQELLAREPPKPPSNAYVLFFDTHSKDGHSEKKIKKSWDALAPLKKEKYEAKVEKMKENYIKEYKDFLTSMSPSDLKRFSEYQNSLSKKTAPSENAIVSSDEYEEDSSSSDNEDQKTPDKKPSSTSSSSSSSSSTSSSDDEDRAF